MDDCIGSDQASMTFILTNFWFSKKRGNVKDSTKEDEFLPPMQLVLCGILYPLEVSPHTTQESFHWAAVLAGIALAW